MPEYRVIGPPGCGKTTWLAKKVKKDAEKRGSESIVIASLTKTAAREVVGRDLPIDDEQVGTLHSHAFRSLGNPKIADTATGIKAWNEENKKTPSFCLSSAQDFDRETDGGMGNEVRGDGNRIMGDIAKFRAKMIKPEFWSHAAQRFWKRWCEWKKANDLLDFTDLIERALLDVDKHPIDPEVFLIDEAQDMDALEFALARKWGEHCDQFVVVGDADQCLYEWRGSNSKVMMTPELPEDRVHVLSQSYRVPIAVHQHAVRWINRATDRQKVEYKPRNHPGFVYTLGDGNIKYPEPIIEDARRHLAEGKSVMFLTACGYMLEELIRTLREQGVPFHNPYRRKRGDWNPMAIGKRKQTAVNRLLAFLRPDKEVWGDMSRFWNKHDVISWASIMRGSGNMVRGAKGKLKELLPGSGEEWEEEISISGLLGVFEGDALERAINLDLEWYVSQIDKAHEKGMRFPVSVVRKSGGKSLTEDPKIIVGTIHSVKGGEADVVYVFPDISRNGMDAISRDMNPVYRQFYVAFTRAREGLVLCQPSSRFSLEF